MLKYKLIDDSLNDVKRPVETVLTNRGISHWQRYLNLDTGALEPPERLINIADAVECFVKHYERKSQFHIVCDSDVDGYTSASMLHNFISNQLHRNVSYSLHTEKQHGLSDITIPDNVDIVIVPDASTNDVEECKILYEKGIDIIVLDHHIKEYDNPYAIIVNSNINYPNPSLTGAGVVYKFIQLCDEYLWTNFSEHITDLTALGIIADMADLRYMETKYICELGLSKIKNPLFKELLDKQSFKIGNDITIQNIQFYIIPLLNALIRFGEQEHKDLLFKALSEINQTFDYKKRGSQETVKENIYEHVTRLAVNTKSKQDRAVTKSMDYCETLIEQNNLNNNKILFVDASKNIPTVLSGAIASKLADKYKKPCLVLQLHEDGIFKGSGRNCRNSDIGSLKEFLQNTNEFIEVIGHDDAFGCSINSQNCISAIKKINKLLKNNSNSKLTFVDFDIDNTELDISVIKEIESMKHLFGMCVEEPLFHVRNIELNLSDGSLVGKQMNTWRFIDDENGVTYIKFLCNNDDTVIQELTNNDDDWGIGSNNTITINAICTLGINNYNGILTPQVIIKQYERIS